MKSVFILCLAVLLFSCKSPSNINTNNQKNNTIVEEKSNNILMEVSPYTLPIGTSKVELKITNHTKEIIQFGAPYTLEQFDSDTRLWKELPLGEIAFIAIMYMLPPGESQTYDINLYPNDIKYTAGTYRVKKQFFAEETNKEVYAEFIIK